MTDNPGKKAAAYAGIVFVVLIWGVYPVICAGLLEHYSAGAFTFSGSLISAVALLVFCIPRLKDINADYLRTAVPTGAFVGFASTLQKIGLRYTTPSRYAFLENLSCVAVPVVLYLVFRKKPGKLTVIASLICLSGCFVLTAPDLAGDGRFHLQGELLCAAAGILYGVNIAATGTCARDLNAMLYVMIQMWTNVLISGAAAAALALIRPGGVPLERFVFSFDPVLMLELAALVLSVSTLGWIIRTESMKHVSASSVAVIMPFSSVITGIAAIVSGKDVFSPFLLAGGALIVVSSVLSGIGEVRAARDTCTGTEDKS